MSFCLECDSNRLRDTAGASLLSFGMLDTGVNAVGDFFYREPMTWTQADEEVFLKGLEEEAFEGDALENHGKSDKMTAGAVSGAYNDSNDPEGKNRDAHAELYYASVCNSKKDYIVDAISQSTGIDSDRVSKMFDHLFINEYDLDKGHTRFDPDYYIAESVQRLRAGKNMQEHDLILVYHEAMEYDLMNRDGLDYEEAHELANRFF